MALCLFIVCSVYFAQQVNQIIYKSLQNIEIAAV